MYIKILIYFQIDFLYRRCHRFHILRYLFNAFLEWKTEKAAGDIESTMITSFYFPFEETISMFGDI